MPAGAGKQQSTSLSTTLMERSRFAWQAGMTFQGADGSFRRSMNRTLGYQVTLAPQDYILRYKRGGVAKRIIDAYPRAAWVAGTQLVEDEDAQSDTAFEQAAAELFARLDVWARLQRADILAGLGNYAVLLIGGAGELSTELKKFRKSGDVLYLRALAQQRARISEIETDKKSPRFGLPLYYSLSAAVSTNMSYSGMPNQVADAGGRVHWSRIIHIAHGLLEDDVYGTPVLEAPWNYLDDLDKIIGGGAEATWKNMDPGRLINVDPEAEWTPEKSAALKDQIEEFDDGLVRWLRTQGVDVKTLSGAVPQIAASADTVIKLIAGTLGYPMRIFVGSERGHLASTQDRDNWNDQVTGYRREFAEPFVRAFVDRLIEYGALPEPANGYRIAWPEEQELSEQAKAANILVLAQANEAQVAAEGKLITTGDEIRDLILGMEPLAPEQQPAPKVVAPPQPPVTTPPEPQLKVAAARVSPIHRVISAHAPKIVAAVISAWLASAHRVDAAALDDALAQRSEAKASAVVAEALDLSPITAAIDDAYAAGGDTAAEKLAARHLRALYSDDQPRDANGRWSGGAETQGPSYRAQDEKNQALHDQYVHGYRHAQTGYGYQKSSAGRGRARDAYRRGYNHGGDDSMWQDTSKWSRGALAEPLTVADAISIVFDMTNPRAVAYARAQGSRLITEVTDSIREAVAEIVREGLAANLSRTDIIKRIKETVGLRSDQVAALERFRSTEGVTEMQAARYAKRLLTDRAELIGRTETARAANAGQREAWSQAIEKGLLPQDQQRAWIGNDDGFERDSHIYMNDQVVGVNDSFIAEDGEPLEPGEEPNCRCGMDLVQEKADA